MASPVNPADLTNVLQALTTVLQKFQVNPTVSPAAAAPAAHVNIMDAFESVKPFELGYQAVSYAFSKSGTPLNETGTAPSNNSLLSSSVFVSVHPKFVGITQHLKASSIFLGQTC